MKIVHALLCCLCATGACAQSSVGGSALSSEPQMVEFHSHAARATQQELATPQDLLEKTSFVVIKGVRPLWEMAPPAPISKPLGDTARMLRKEHEISKKATVLWEN
jgi:hypothetical protein